MYNRQELCIHLLESGCSCSSYDLNDGVSYLDKVDNEINFNFPLSALEDIVFELSSSGLTAKFRASSGTTITLPEAKIGKQRSLYGYIKSLQKRVDLSEKLVDTITEWMKIYKYGYTYNNFRKSIFNNVTATYSVILHHNLQDLSKVTEAESTEISLNFIHNTLQVYVFAQQINLNKEQISIADFFSFNTFEDVLGLYASIPVIANYRRKKVIDDMLLE